MRVAYQSGAMIPTAQAAPVRGRVAGLLRSAIAPAFLVSGLLHAVALSWGLAPGHSAAPAGLGALPLQVRLAEPTPAPVASPTRPALAAAPRQSTAPPAAAVMAVPAQEVRRLAVPAVSEAAARPVVAPPVATALDDSPRREPLPAVVSTATSRIADAQAESDTVRADYQALLRAAAERLQRYPERARRLGFEGTAVVAVELQPDAAALRVVLVRSSGIGMLDRAALDLLDRAAREVDPATASVGQGQLRFPVRYALHDGRD